MKYKTILVTGAAGFIGFHICKDLINRGLNVYGIDNINDYYDIDLKYARLDLLGIKRESIESSQEIIKSEKFNEKFKFSKINIENLVQLETFFEKNKFDNICHLAAQAGVRFSLKNPNTYIQSNLVGFANILELSINSSRFKPYFFC